jgi:hypothetical protein
VASGDNSIKLSGVSSGTGSVILGHWVRGTTNAFLAGLNSVFSAVKRKARGFRSTDNLITMLYFTAGKLDLPVTH